MPSMNFNYRDIYPEYAGTETSTEVAPEADDMEALEENKEDAEAVSNTHARGKNMIFACIVLIAAVVFLGGAR